MMNKAFVPAPLAPSASLRPHRGGAALVASMRARPAKARNSRTLRLRRAAPDLAPAAAGLLTFGALAAVAAIVADGLWR